MAAMKHVAQDKIIAAICNEALKADEDDNAELAEAIRKEGCRIARKWDIREVHGLPGTFKCAG